MLFRSGRTENLAKAALSDSGWNEGSLLCKGLGKGIQSQGNSKGKRHEVITS